MNAVEFVKKFGIDLVKRDVAAWQGGFIKREDFLEHYGFDILDDLKQIVEAWELVEKAGGVDGSKVILASIKPWHTGYNIVSKTYFGGDVFSPEQEFYISDLLKSINLVEKCQ